MVSIRRVVHVVAWIGTLAVGLLALALIVSQTPWFRDWIRRTIIREARQYVNGELTIGQVTGNLFFDFGLSDVAVDLSGDRVVAIKTVAVGYSVFELVSRGIVVDRITLTAPRVHLVRDGEGWNIRRLVKDRAREADRRGPKRSIALPSIAIVDGAITVDDASGTTNYRLPRRIDDLDVQASFAYEPVHFTVGVSHLSFRGADPDLVVQQLTGAFAVRNDNLYLERMVIKTGESALERWWRHRRLPPHAGDQARHRRDDFPARSRANRSRAGRLSTASRNRREYERDARSPADGSGPQVGGWAASRSTHDRFALA